MIFLWGFHCAKIDWTKVVQYVEHAYRRGHTSVTFGKTRWEDVPFPHLEFDSGMRAATLLGILCEHIRGGPSAEQWWGYARRGDPLAAHLLDPKYRGAASKRILHPHHANDPILARYRVGPRDNLNVGINMVAARAGHAIGEWALGFSLLFFLSLFNCGQ